MASRMRRPERNGRLLSDSLVSCSMDDPADPTLNAKNILSYLNVITEWRTLGIQLNVPQHKLDKIEIERLKVDDRMEQMVAYWLNNAKATWKELIDALNKIDKRTLARTIESQYPELKRKGELKEQTENRELLEIEERIRNRNHEVLDRTAKELKQMGERYEAQNPWSLSVGAKKLYDLESDFGSKLKEAHEAIVRDEGQLKREMYHHTQVKEYEDIKHDLNIIISLNESKEKDIEARIQRLEIVGGHEKELREHQDMLRECLREIQLQQAKLRIIEFKYLQEQKEHERVVDTIRLEKVETTYMEALASDLSDCYDRLRERGQFLDESISRLEKETA